MSFYACCLPHAVNSGHCLISAERVNGKGHLISLGLRLVAGFQEEGSSQDGVSDTGDCVPLLILVVILVCATLLHWIKYVPDTLCPTGYELL